jgi:hypothetical protein
MLALRPSSCIPTLAMVLGCAGGDGVRPDAGTRADGGGAIIDGAVGHGPGTAVLVPLAVGDERPIGVFTVYPDGALVDRGIRLDAPSIARGVAFSPDGREALAIYGNGPSAAKGVLHVLLEPDGGTAEIVQELPLDASNSPNSILFESTTQAVLAMRGPDPDFLRSLSVTDGWTVGPDVVTFEGPSMLYDIGEPGHALLLQWDLFTDDGYHAYPVGRREDGGWEVEAAGVDFGTERIIQLAMAPSGDFAYAPVSNPDDDAPLNRSGLLMTIGVDEDRSWSEVGERVPLEDMGSQIAISREGEVIVVLDSVAYIDPNTGPAISHFELETIRVSEGGALEQITGPRTMIAGTYLSDLAFAPGETLLVALDRQDGYGLIAFQRDNSTASSWRVASMLEVEGSPAAVFIGPGAGGT